MEGIFNLIIFRTFVNHYRKIQKLKNCIQNVWNLEHEPQFHTNFNNLKMFFLLKLHKYQWWSPKQCRL